ncbi:MAG: tetratricopeptide repeat protein [Deltaproteobacteria bacterium]|nr:tetratricopeptide repeat protein [Deltaproteobacteria bacterium]
MSGRGWVFSALLAALLAAPRAEAQPSGACRHLDRSVALGNDLRRRGEATAAFEHFTHMVAECPSGRALAQLALVETDLRRWRDALAHLQSALAMEDRWISAHHEALATELSRIREHLARIDLRTDRPDVELALDGAVVGVLPLGEARVLQPGAVRVELRAPGRPPWRRTYQVHEGQLVDDFIRLEGANPTPSEPEVTPTASPAAAAPTAAVTAAPSVAPPTPPPATPHPAAPPAGMSTLRVAGWVSLGVGAALGVTGLVLGLTNPRSSTPDSSGVTPPAPGSPAAMDWTLYAAAIMVSPADAATICSRAQMDAVIPFAADVRSYCRLRGAGGGNAGASSSVGAIPLALGITGAVLAAAGVVLVLVGGSRAQTTVTPVVTADGAGLWLTGRF